MNKVTKQMQVKQIIVDREGMAVEFLASLQEAGRVVVTVLRTDQYRDLTSFTDVGIFVPFHVDREGSVIREVAPARIAFPRPEHPGEVLSLQVVLIRDLRRMVAVQPEPEETVKPQPKRKADRKPDECGWTQEGWQATPTPATPVTPKLIPIVSTADISDPVELAQTYIHLWPVQENVIKDFLRPLGLDINHGFAKTEVPNSEVSKQGLPLVRVIVARHPAHPAGKSVTVGKRIGEWVYELFLTDLDADGFLAEDVVDLYHGRGAFEAVLSDEDVEEDPDRWCSYTPCGQELW